MADSVTPPSSASTRFIYAGERALATIAVIIVAAVLNVAVTTGVRAQPACLPLCGGQTLTTPNFSHANLANASFAGATLIGPVFIHADLTGADFSGATFVSAPGNPMQTPDFTFANLTNAKFVGAKFDAPTYFTRATLTCADFSKTNLTNNNAVFGEEQDPPRYNERAGCRIKFQGTTMNCELIDEWALFDLTNADISACLGELAGRNFAQAMMSGVNFASAILDGTTFTKAELKRAIFDNASLQCGATRAGTSQCVDFSGALLQGALFNNANLTGASLFKAFLSNNTNGNVTDAASLQQAHLKNVNLAGAQLSGVSFEFANFYGSNPANPLGCTTTGDAATPPAPHAGFTVNCASAADANMTGTKFVDAYLYGVDFRNASLAGVNFTQAILTGANFSGTTIGTDNNTGAITTFDRAYLQGTNLDQATLAQADLTDAFVDFRTGGNDIYIALDGTDHNQFACSDPSTCKPATGQDVCVFVKYPTTTVPIGNTTITCPHGLPAGPSGCGVADPAAGNVRWNSRLTIGTPPDPGPPPGWYSSDATFAPKAPSSEVCNGRGPQAAVFFW